VTVTSKVDALKDSLVMLLAGGQGERLHPLTRNRAKPAVPFGGIYRIIDFSLSNCVNSGVRKINVLTQYKSFSLQRHLQFGWNIFRPQLDEYINVVPPQLRTASRWYLGTADAIYQNIYLLERERPRNVVVLAGDHIYKMNYRHLLEAHLDRDAEVTVASFSVPCDRAARQLGVAVVDAERRITHFQEKPDQPAELPDHPGLCLSSMGVYVFKTEALVRDAIADAKTDSYHDIARDLLPAFVERGSAFAFLFAGSDTGQAPYWRDIGTLDAYWEANFDLVQVQPAFNLYDRDWPVHTYQPAAPPAKTVFNELPDGRRGRAMNSLVSSGSIISGAYVEESVLSPNVYVHAGADVRQCVVLDDVEIGRGARLRRVVVDKRVRIPDGAVIGYDEAADRGRFTVSDGGVVVVPEDAPLTPSDQ
jgi:glucose-1-phosphate adenylyltransferase